MNELLSAEFWGFYSYFSLGFLIASVVIGVLFLVLGGRSGASVYISPESRLMWVKPLVVFAGFTALWGDIQSETSLWIIFVVTFIAGLVSGLTSIPPMVAIRDWILSAISILIAGGVFFMRISSDPEMRVVYLLLMISILVGLVIGGITSLPDPVTGIAILGAMEIVDFLLSPFGPSNFSGIESSLWTVGVVGAVIIGVLVRIESEFVILLAGSTIAVLGVFLQVFLWFEASNYPAKSIVPEWNVAVAWLGIGLGYAILRSPYSMSGVTRLT